MINDTEWDKETEAKTKKPAQRRVVTKYPYDLVEVLWLDAETTNGWEGEDEIEPEVPVVITVGFLVKHTHKLVCIASSTGDDRSHNSRMVIPAGMVQSIRVIKKESKPRKSK